MLLRSGSVLIALFALALPAWPEAQETPAGTVVKLKVSPVAVPQPALRWQLLPEAAEMQPGNPVHGYLICFGEQQNFFFKQEAVDEREKLLVMPLAELPADKVKGYGSGAMRQMDWAARLETPDWQILLKAKRDGHRLLLPELQQLRMLASAMKVRMRGEVKAGEFGQAVGSAKSLLALARHLDIHPTLIGPLVGTAIGMVAVGPLEEFVGQDGAPNLFWAFATLPQPFMSFRGGMQGERMFVNTEFGGMFDGHAPLTEAQLGECLRRAQALADLTHEKPADAKDVAAAFRARAADAAGVAAAKKRLLAFGATEEELKAMPALQAVLLDEFRKYEALRDDMVKWLPFPFAKAEAPLLAAGLKADAGRGETVFGSLAPALLKVKRAARLDRRLALLAVVEGLRHHAATHAGKWPASLAEVELPLPNDPMADKPFAYRVDGATAILDAPAPKEADVKAFAVRVELSLR